MRQAVRLASIRVPGVLAGCGLVALVLAACASPRPHPHGSPTVPSPTVPSLTVPSLTVPSPTVPSAATSSTVPTTAATASASSRVAVPDVVGDKIAAAHAALRASGFRFVPLNPRCDKGTYASQSVVQALALSGLPSSAPTKAFPITPGFLLPTGSLIGITWSACYAGDAPVPYLVGLTFAAAQHALHAVGLTWACYSAIVPQAPSNATSGTAPASTSTSSTTTSSTTTTTTTTTSSSTTTTTTTPGFPWTVLSQNPGAGSVLPPGTTVTFTMLACPQ